MEATNDLITGILPAAGAYAVAAGLLTMLPGPDTAIVITTAVRAGRAAAMRAALGIAVGLLLWGAAASVGIAAALRSSAEVYTVFKFACAAYLVWLAFTALRAALHRRASDASTPASTPASPPASGPAHVEEPATRRFHLPWGFRQALLTAMLNPKLGVFFVAFLPQFIPPGTSTLGMTMFFSAIQAAEALIWFLLIGRLAALAKRWLNRPRVRHTMDGVTAAVFLGFGARVVLEQ